MTKQQWIISSYQNLVAAFKAIKALGYGKAYVVEVKPFTRTIEQNSKLHATFADLARQATWQGQKLTAEQWKVLMISAHTIATKENHKMVIGIEGEVVNLRESSAQMSVARMISLIEYIHAWGASNGVQFNE